jgi:hypothetical protein
MSVHHTYCKVKLSCFQRGISGFADAYLYFNELVTMRRLNPHRDYLQIMSSVYIVWNVKGEFLICLLLADWSIFGTRSKRHLNYV